MAVAVAWVLMLGGVVYGLWGKPLPDAGWAILAFVAVCGAYLYGKQVTRSEQRRVR